MLMFLTPFPVMLLVDLTPPRRRKNSALLCEFFFFFFFFLFFLGGGGGGLHVCILFILFFLLIFFIYIFKIVIRVSLGRRLQQVAPDELMAGKESSLGSKEHTFTLHQVQHVIL